MPDVFGLPLQDLPRDSIPVDAVVVVKFLADGQVGYDYKETEGLPTFEAFGMLHWAARAMMDSMLDDTEPQDG